MYNRPVPLLQIFYFFKAIRSLIAKEEDDGSFQKLLKQVFKSRKHYAACFILTHMVTNFYENDAMLAKSFETSEVSFTFIATKLLKDAFC